VNVVSEGPEREGKKWAEPPARGCVESENSISLGKGKDPKGGGTVVGP